MGKNDNNWKGFPLRKGIAKALNRRGFLVRQCSHKGRFSAVDSAGFVK